MDGLRTVALGQNVEDTRDVDVLAAGIAGLDDNLFFAAYIIWIGYTDADAERLTRNGSSVGGTVCFTCHVGDVESDAIAQHLVVIVVVEFLRVKIDGYGNASLLVGLAFAFGELFPA